MSSLEFGGTFEGIDDLDDQKHDIEKQERRDASAEEDNDDEEDDDDLTPPARQQEMAMEKAIMQLSHLTGASSLKQSNTRQHQTSQSSSNATSSSPLPVVGRQRQGSIDSSDHGYTSSSPQSRLPPFAASSGSPTPSSSAAALAARIVTSRARSSSISRPSNWAASSPTQGQFSSTPPTSSYATQPPSDYAEATGTGQSPSNKSDFATYMQQTQGSRRLSLDRRHSYSVNRLASPSPGEFTATPPSPTLSADIQQDSPKARPVDADEAWVDLSSSHTTSRAIEADSSSSHASHARTVSDPFPRPHISQSPQRSEASVRSLLSLRSDASPPPGPDYRQAPTPSAIASDRSSSPSRKMRSKSAGVSTAQSPRRSSFPHREISNTWRISEDGILPEQPSSRTPASPRAISIARPSLLRQHSSPTKSISSSRSSRSGELNLSGVSSPREASTSSHHRRSPSFSGHVETFSSLSPSIPPVHPPDLALYENSEGSRSSISPLEPGPPIGLALDSLQAFRFVAASPSSQIARDHVPSPPFLPSDVSPSASGATSNAITEGAQYRPISPSSRPLGNPDLSLPPPSGFELSDDMELDVSPFDEHSDDTDMFGPFPGAPGSFHSSLADLPTIAEAVDLQDDAPPSPLMSSIPLPLFDEPSRSPSHKNAKSPDWGVALDYDKRDSLVGNRSDSKENSPRIHSDAESAIDEEALTPLEKIFLFAKSEVVEHRETVSRALPRWIKGVEICEAVDYVLPLLEGLACDEELVKEAFAASLDSLVYHFLTNCPLQELDASHQIARLDTSSAHADSLEAQLDEAAEAGISTSLVVTQQGLKIVERPELASHIDEISRQQELVQARQGWPDDSKTVTPGTGSTMRSSDNGTAADLLSGNLPKDLADTVPRPHISFALFHELFGLLLLNDSSVISSLAQESIARLMLRVNGQPVPNDELDLQAVAEEDEANDQQNEATSLRTHNHGPYEFSSEARSIVRRDILGNIVGAIANIDASSPPQLAKLLGGRSSTGSSQVQTPALEVKDADAAAQISSFFSSTSSPHPSQRGNDHILDARQGRFVALSCLNLLIDSEAVSADLQAEYLLPIAINGARDSDPMIRMAAVDALAGLAKMAGQMELADQILPAFELASTDDNVQVRRAVCGSFQEVVQALQNKVVLRNITVSIASALYRDEVPQVRQGILEVIGPLIHLFAGDVPEELVLIFEGFEAARESQTLEQRSSPDAPLAFQPLVPAFAVAERTETETNKAKSGWDVSNDHERAIITAYNLPGVLLSLGSSGWPRLRSLHGRLATEAGTSQARYLIASSVHDVAKLIGPEAATTDLLPMLPKLATDDDSEVSERLFERLAPLADCLSPEGLPTYIRLICDWWDITTRRNWHRRDMLAEATAQLATRLEDNQGLFPAFLYLLKQILRDDVACVRQWGMQTLSVAMACSDADLLEQLREMWEGLAADSHHKYRSLSANAIATVSSTVALEQPFLLDLLVNLADDPIPGVRIGVARALRYLCINGGPYDLERPPLLQAALVRLATSDSTASVRELLVNVRLDPLPDDIGLDDIGEDASFSSSDEEDASDAVRKRKSSGAISTAQPIAFTKDTNGAQEDLGQSMASPPVDTWNLADLASPLSKTHDKHTVDERNSSYTSFDSLLPRWTEGRLGTVFSPSRMSGHNNRTPSSSSYDSFFTPSSPLRSSSSYDTQQTPDNQWHLSMRDVDQFVAIDLAV